MPTLYAHEVFVIATAAVTPTVIAGLDQAFPRDDGQARNPADIGSVACSMSASGSAPVTHYGAAFAIKESVRAQLEGMGLNALPGVTYWRCSNPEGLLVATNHPASVASIGQAWGWSQCKAALGIKQLGEA